MVKSTLTLNSCDCTLDLELELLTVDGVFAVNACRRATTVRSSGDRVLFATTD